MLDDQRRLSLLVRAGEIFHRSLDVQTTLENIAQLATEWFADICMCDLIDPRSSLLYISVATHRDPDRQRALGGAAAFLYDGDYGPHPVLRVTITGTSFFAPNIDADPDAFAASARHAQFMRALGYRCKIVVPIVAEQRIFGALTFVVTSPERRFGRADLTLAEDLGRRAGLAIANATRYQHEHHVAETLQRAFLGEALPLRAGVTLHAMYRPGGGDGEIGGDWYDAFETPRGELVVTIGDVAGKGVDAARLMVQVREAIRVAALDNSSPTGILDVANRAFLYGRHGRHASTFVAVIAPDLRSLRYASAGQPPPLLRPRHGDVVRLAAPMPPLGVDRTIAFEEHALAVAEGDTLLLYTDGAIEVKRDAVDGEERLARLFASEALPYAADPARFLERTFAGATPRDDVAMLVIRFGEGGVCWRFDAENPRSAYAGKAEFLDVLGGIEGDGGPDVESSELIFAELIGNAVRHAPGPLSLSLSLDADGATLHVVDHGPGFEYRSALPADIWSESGRGLFLITALARSVRVERLPGYGAYIAVGLPIRRANGALVAC